MTLPTLDKDSIRDQTLELMDLVDAGNIAQRAMEKRLCQVGLSVAQQRILGLLYLARETLTPSMLATLLLQEMHSVSGLLNRLEDRDLITRTHDKRDRRVVWVGLTTKGRRLAKAAIDVVLAIAKELDPVFGAGRSHDGVGALRELRDMGFKVAGVNEKVRREALKRLWGK